MNKFFLLLILLISSQFALADISCKKGAAGWQPFNTNGTVLGNSSYAFGTEADCKAANPDPKAPAACNWNGTNYSMYSAVDGSSFEGKDAQYSRAKDCYDSIKDIKNGKMCVWNSANWQPIHVGKRAFYGTDGYGFKEYSKCIESISAVTSNKNCNWNGSYYSIYEPGESSSFEGKNASYSDAATCALAISENFAGKACLYNAANWQPFSLKAKSFLGQDGFGFKERKECLDTIKTAKDEYSCNWNGTDYSLYSSKNPDDPFSVMSFLTVPYCQDYIKRLTSSAVDVKSIPSSDLLKEFYPKTATVGYTYTDCQDPNYSFHLIKKDASGNLPDSCLPDTLYSWGDYGKITWFRERYEKSGDWNKPFDRDLYLTQSPLATFGYGPVPLRMKLKPGTKVRVSNQSEVRLECKHLTAAEKQNTIIAAQWALAGGTGLDYKLCSMGPIESWSYGTKQHYDEIIRDYNWVESHNYKDYELYYKKDGVDQLWDTSLDGHSFSNETFIKHMRNIRQLIELKLGGVFYQDTGGTQVQHFKTKKSIYYNP